MMLTKLFCEIDDFCQRFEPEFYSHLLTLNLKTPLKTRLSLSEIMTNVVHFHQAGYRCFKHYYQRYNGIAQQNFLS